MKTLTCKDLGGPCNAEITGETFEEVGNNAKAHVVKKISAGDMAHMNAVTKMQKATPQEVESMMVEWKKKFDEA